MYILKNIIKLILGVCVVCNMFGCGLYMISKNEDVVANASIGTSKATLKERITAGYGAEKCRIFGRLNNEVFESCPILLSAKDRYNNNIFYVNDKYVGIGNNNVFSTNYFNSLDTGTDSSAFKNKSIILLTREDVGFVGSIGTVDLFVNNIKVSELTGHETAYIWDQDPGDVDVLIKQKDRLLNSTLFKVEKGVKYLLKYNYSTGAVSLKNDESSNIYFTSIPPGAVVFAGKDPNSLKPTQIITPHTMTRPPGSYKWAAEYYKLSLDGHKDSPIIFKNNPFGDRIVHYNFDAPSSPEPPLSELPIRRTDTPRVLISPAVPQ